MTQAVQEFEARTRREHIYSPAQASNAEFLAALRVPGDTISSISTDAVLWVCHFPGDAQRWKGESYMGGEFEYPAENTFFSISMVKPINGETHRRKANFAAMLCVVLDDIGTKAKTPSLEPSWIIETSPGNEQWGYILDTPITNPELAERLMKAIIAAGYCDPGAGGPETRYMRLPVGSNGKKEHVEKNGELPVPHKLIAWHSQRWFALDELISGLGLTLEGTDKEASSSSHDLVLDDVERLPDDELIRQILRQENYHAAILTLTARYHTRGMKKDAIIQILRGFMRANEDKSERWQQRYDDIPRAVVGAIEKFSTPMDRLELSYVDFSSLAYTSPPPRRWTVPEWLPRGTVTVLFGKGGIGKSLLAQQLAVAVANGEKWLGLETTKGSVLGLFCEDENDELLRRGLNIFTGNFIDPATGSEGLYLDARAGKPNTLVTFGTDRQASPTALLDLIKEQCEKLRPALVILDNIAQMFSGLENDRYQVTAFCNMLTELARKYECAVLLLGHPAKAKDSEYSGSTAWEAAVRTRIFLEHKDDGTLRLRKAKANYSELEEFTIEYQNGMFVPYTVGSDISQAVKEATSAILKAIETYSARQESCSHCITARNYLVKKMAENDMLGGFTEKVLQRSLGHLIDTKALLPNALLPWKSASRHKVTGLALNGGDLA